MKYYDNNLAAYGVYYFEFNEVVWPSSFPRWIEGLHTVSIQNHKLKQIR